MGENAWEADILPLNYARKAEFIITVKTELARRLISDIFACNRTLLPVNCRFSGR